MKYVIYVHLCFLLCVKVCQTKLNLGLGLGFLFCYLEAFGFLAFGFFLDAFLFVRFCFFLACFLVTAFFCDGFRFLFAALGFE